MADNDVSCRQRAVIEFLVKEEIPAANIRYRFQRVYGDVCMGASSVGRWVKRFKNRENEHQRSAKCDRPRTASTEPKKKRVDEIITEDRHVTLYATATKLGIGHNAVQEIIGSLDSGKFVPAGYRVYWLKTIRFRENPSLQKCFGDIETKEMIFLPSSVTGDERWFHHFDPETKRQSMEWHHLDSPTKEKPKTMPSAKKIMGTLFWDAEGCILIELLEPGKTIRPPHTRTVLPSVLTAQAKLCQVCTVWPARGFTAQAQLKLKEIDKFSF